MISAVCDSIGFARIEGVTRCPGLRSLDCIIGGKAFATQATERSVVQAEGALVWGVGNSSGTFEFRAGGSSWRKKQYPDIFSLHGSYVCDSGAEYKYYGKCISWVPGVESRWEAYLYRYDKYFKYDGIFDSPDLLAKLEGLLINIRLNGDTLRMLSVSEIERQIEEWDAA